MSANTANVRLHVRENDQPIPGALVQLHYPAHGSKGAFVGEAVTGADGRATVRLDRRGIDRVVGRLGSRAGHRPDGPSEFLVKVLNSRGREVMSTSVAAQRGRLGLDLILGVPLQQALAGKLVVPKPSASVANKQAYLFDRWLKDVRRDDPAPPEDLCLANLVLTTVANLENPKNDFEARAAQRIKERLPASVHEQVAKAAAKAGAFVEDRAAVLAANHDADALSHVADGGCSPDDLEAMIGRWLKPGGRFGQLTKALKAGDPPPSDVIGPAGLGRPFGTPFSEWDKDCQANFEAGNALPTDQAQSDMEAYFPDELMVVTMPQINRVEVWDETYGTYVRVGHRATKVLEITTLDVTQGWADDAIEMDLPLTSGACLIDQEDLASPGMQALAVDVRPGQQVLLRGSGYIAEKVTLIAERAGWTGSNDGADNSGRLISSDNATVATGLDGIEVEVHGAPTHADDDDAATFVGDIVEFVWPEDVDQPGLYSVRLDFGPVPPGLVVDASQDPTTCELDLTTPEVLHSQVLWFAVLPELKNRDVSFHAERLVCVDEKDPEFWPNFDDIAFNAFASLQQVDLDPITPDNSTLEELASVDHQQGNWFYADGDDWTPNLKLAPDGSATHLDFRHDQILMVGLSANEVSGVADNLFIAALITAIVIVVILLLALIIVLIVIALVAFFATGPIGPIVVAIIGSGTAIAGGVIAVLAPPIFAALTAALATMPSTDPVLLAVTGYSGLEMAHRLADNRWQRRLWTHARPAQPVGLVTMSSDFDATDDGFVESFTGENEMVASTYQGDIRITEAP